MEMAEYIKAIYLIDHCRTPAFKTQLIFILIALKKCNNL